MWNYKAVYIIFKLWDVDMIVLRSTNRTTHFVLQGYNECSLNIMITTPSLFANKGAFSSCVTNDRWCGAIKVIYSFPFFLISSRAVRWSESISCSSWFFSFLSPSFFFFFFLNFLWTELELLMWGNISLLTSQALWGMLDFSRSLGHRWVDWSQHLWSEILAAGDTCLPPRMTRGVVYSPCRAGQWNELFHVCM